MKRRVLIVGGAVAIALALLVATFQIAPGDKRPVGPAEGPPSQQDLPRVFGPEDLVAGQRPLGTQGSAGRGRIIRVDEGRVTVLTWQTIEPGDIGVYDIGLPAATVEFSKSRVLTVTAKEATIIAPGNTLRRGEFRGDVVVTFYDADDGVVDLSSDRDIQVRVYLDEDAAFDLELGQITSNGPLHLTGPRVDFRGSGLSLKYNRLRERIERLVVDQGESLRFSASHTRMTDRRKQEASGDRVAGSADADRDETSDRPPQFYRAKFSGGVHVEAGRGGDPAQAADLSGDELEVTFAIDRRRVQEQDKPKPAAPVADAGSPARAQADGQTGRADAGAPGGRSLMPVREDDVLVRWTGPLVVRPLAADDQPDDEDAMGLTVRGVPARVKMGNGDSVTGRMLAFDSVGQRFVAAGDGEAPLRVYSREMGELTGGSLEISQTTGIGGVAGAGSMVARVSEDASEGTVPSSIAWSDRMAMSFFIDKEADPGKRLAALKHAEFHGDVRIAHGDDRMAGDTLVMDFTRDPNEPRRSSPSKLSARGEVSAEQPGMRFTAQTLEVTMSPRAADSAAKPGDTTGLLGGDIAVDRVTASGQVTVHIAEQNATAQADSLIAEPEKQQVVLTGSDDRTAFVSQPDGRLTGKIIELDQARERVRVNGPGQFAHRLDEEDADAQLVVAWGQRMAFDHRSGQATFEGDVRANSTKAGDTSELTSDRLVLAFEPEKAGDALENGAASDAGRRDDVMRIRSLVAEGDVTFSAASRGEDPHAAPRSRLLIEGPQLTFDNTPNVDPAQAVERVQVIGEGRMLVENYGDQQDAGTGNETEAESEGGADPVNFAGEGATLFLWTGSLTLDAAGNDMTIVDDVQMLHRPVGRGEDTVIQLDCQRLYADLTRTGGLTAWSSQDAPDATLRRIECDTSVRLLYDERQISADHLRYTAADQAVFLWRDRGQVDVIDNQGGTSMSAEAIKWDLANDAIEATKIRGGTTPIRRD